MSAGVTWESLQRLPDGRLAGRNDQPAILFDAFFGGVLTDVDEIAKGVEDAWTSAEFPERLVDRLSWLVMFGHVGFLHDGKRAEPPTEPLTLYRAAPFEHRLNLAWTDDLERARWFNDRNNDLFGIDSKLWTMRVDPVLVLAHFESARNESEYIAHASDGLVTQLVGTR